MTESNSFQSTISQFITLGNNSLELVTNLGNALVSGAETINITLTDPTTGESVTRQVPSIGFLNNEIRRVDENVKRITGNNPDSFAYLDENNQIRQVYIDRVIRDIENQLNFPVPKQFITENNFFFESFISPFMKVAIDISQYSERFFDQFLVKRIIVNADTDALVEYFNDQFNGRNDIVYEDMLISLEVNNVPFSVDDNIVNLPPRVVQFSGKFSVLNFKDSEVTLNGETLVRRQYMLDKITYTDNLIGGENSIVLDIGDILLVKESQYQVENVNPASNTIIVKRVKGYDKISVGSDIFEIKSPALNLRQLQVAVGYNEYQVIFIKPIDKDFNTTATRWAFGVALYTNDLTIETNQGQQTLDEFYRNNVLDFGAQMASQLRERQVPNLFGIVPDVPTLVTDNFSVRLMNGHRFDTQTVKDIQLKSQEKVRLQSEIDQIDKQIKALTEQLTTQQFLSRVERTGVENRVSNLNSRKSSLSSAYATIVQDLTTLGQDDDAIVANRKYRVRGFWDIPQGKFDARTGTQEVVGFDIRYRYLKNDGTPTEAQGINFTNAEGNARRAFFSPFIELSSVRREKVYNSETNEFDWSEQNVEDAEQVNINQLDIPISFGEQVEIQVRTVSEAGYPNNPLVSAYSDPVIITFPDDLREQSVVDNILSDASREQTRVQFQQELNSRGLDEHLATAFTRSGQYFAHDVSQIASGFFTADGNVINLLNKLQSMQNEIDQLRAELTEARGQLLVYLLTENGEQISVANRDTVQLLAGYYSELVAEFPSGEKKGAIATRTYSLVLENTSATAIELYSKFFGGALGRLPNSNIADVGDNNREINDFTYNNIEKYDRVPINFTSVNPQQTANSQLLSVTNFHSSQLLGQYIYCRFSSVGGDSELYVDDAFNGTRALVPNTLISSDGQSETFIWNGGWNNATSTPTGNGALNEFCIHVDHPLVRNVGNRFSTDFFNNLQFPTINVSNNEPVAPFVSNAFRHSKYFNLDASDVNGRSQLSYRKELAFDGTSPLSLNNYADKIGFDANDRFLIGESTCGSYLFLSPITPNDVLVDGVTQDSVFELNNGNSNAISIPIVFQFRMTDYFGEGNSGIGRIGGSDSNIENLTYAKKIGIDIRYDNSRTFSFDVEVTAKYQRQTQSQIGETIVSSRTKSRNVT